MSKIGFKNYETEKNTEELKTLPQSQKGVGGASMPISVAQADLLQKINDLTLMIIDDEFAKYPHTQKVMLVLELKNSISLNIELQTKTMLLIS